MLMLATQVAQYPYNRNVVNFQTPRYHPAAATYMKWGSVVTFPW